MLRLFPVFPPLHKDSCIRGAAHEWVAPAALRRNHHDLYKKLPAGKPDCLRVDILHFDEGVERCTAAVYGGRAYVIHYEFTKRLAENE